MRYYLIADNRETLDGLRLAGIAGCLASDAAQAQAAVDRAAADEGVAVLLVTKTVAGWIPETVARLKLAAKRPLLTVIPGPGDAGLGTEEIMGLISEAIGVKI